MIKWSGLLPPGSVVLLEGAIERLQIIGLVQADKKTLELFDYVAVPFPQGYIDAENVWKFQSEDIGKIYAVGPLDENVYGFLEHAEQRLKDLREGKMTYEEALNTHWKKGEANEV